MKAAITFSIALHRINNAVAFFIHDATNGFIFFFRLREIVIIDKVIARVIWRIYINHLNLAKIILTKNFKHIKIITFNIKIFSIPKIFRCINIWTQSFICCLISKTRSGTLIRPCELIAFLCPVEQVL